MPLPRPPRSAPRLRLPHLALAVCLPALGVATRPAAAVAAPTAAPARPAPAAKTAASLPPARPVDAILHDVVEALGGAAALNAHHSLREKMTITFQGLGITGTAEHVSAAGDKALTTTEIPNVASTREGTDGKTAWSQDPINGLRVLTGAEAEQAHIEAAWNQELRLKELYPKIEAKNEVAADGTPVECLVLTPKLSPPMTDCFDARTHLMVRQRGVRPGPQGDTPFVSRVKDWRKVSGIELPFVTEMQVGPLAFVGTVTEAALDVPVNAAMFEAPAAATGESPGGARGKTADRTTGKTSGKTRAAKGGAAATSP